MMSRSIISRLSAGLLLVTLIFSLGFTVPTPPQPAMEAPGRRLDSFEIAYKESQLEVSEDTRIQAAVNAYFEAKYRSLVLKDAVDIAFVVDLSSDEGWKIRSDSCSTEITSEYPIGTDFEALVRDLPDWYEKWMEANAAQDLQARARLDEFSSRGEPGHYPGLDRPKAADYAHAYADTGNYNTNFFSYSSDCANFYSQCIWAGFDGVNSPAAIDGHDFPMLDGVPGAADWWADSSGSAETWRWIPSFLQMIIDNGNSDLLGPHGIAFGTSPSLICQGCAVVWDDPDPKAPGPDDHIYIVCHVNDLDGDGVTDFNEIWVCAHTENRRHERLSDIVGPSRLTYYRVVCYRVD